MRPGGLPWPAPEADDALLGFALALAHGRRCVVTGEDTPRLARSLLALLRTGAESAVIVTRSIPPDAEDQLRVEAQRWEMTDLAEPLLQRRLIGRGEAGAEPALLCDLPHDWWLRAEWNSPAILHHTGRIDLLIDLSPLDSHRDPLERLTGLAATGARHLMLQAGHVDGQALLRRVGFEVRRQRGTIILGQRA